METPISLINLVYSLIAILVGALVFAKRRPKFPIINSYPGDPFQRRACHEYNTNARRLLARGAAKHGKNPFAVVVPNGLKIILPPSLVGWAKSNKDLDHQQLIRDEFFATFPGFEAQLVLHHPNRMVINMIQGKLSKNDKTLPILNEYLKVGLSDIWGDNKSWGPLDWVNGTTGVISRAAASIFAGPELARDPNWQKTSMTYVQEYFAAVSEMHAWPAWLRPVVQWHLPHASACRTAIHRARLMVNKVVQERRQKAEAAKDQGKEVPEYYDALAWTLEAPAGNQFEPGDVQLSLAMAALFTTAEVFRQVLIEVARHPELVEPLRQEIGDAVADEKITAASLVKMELLDSFMKECQRRIPQLVILERLVTRDTKLPDGTLLLQGTHIAIDGCENWNSDIFDNPGEFDGRRFLKRRQAGDNSSQFVQSSPEHAHFGMGKHQCPGRFFAGTELKLCLAQIMLNYDIRLKDGYKSNTMQVGFLTMADPCAQLEIRKR